MKRNRVLGIVALIAVAAMVPAAAGEQQAQTKAEAGEQAAVSTLEGKVLCAKCTLHAEGATKCQNVLVVEQEGKTEQFYMTKNDVNDKFGEVCTGSPLVRVTGKIEHKDGHAWITATEIKKLSDKG
jgi:hypothetical protein